MKKFFLVVSWLPASILSLLLSFHLLHAYSHIKEGNALISYQAREILPQNGYQFYAALPDVLGSFTTAVSKGDARPEILRQFLKKHASPLETYADTLVTASDTHQIDFRLITSIGMCESNLGKKMPSGSYNAWGYAIYTGQNSGVEFRSWEESINTMADYLYTKFYSQGLTTPEAIGPIYAPPSVETENSWAKCVRKFMDELI